jgi:ubiquinone/menaquinone biosynthesis C-methylase UbiE
MAAEYNSPELIESFNEIALLPERRWSNNTHYTKSVLKEINPLIGGVGVDAGCGIGDGARKLSGIYKKVVGYDISPSMIEKAKELSEDFEGITYINESFLDADIEEASCGCVLCVSMLHHMDMEAFFKKAKRVLKKGGRLLVVDLYKMATIGDALTAIAASFLKKPYLFFRGALKVTFIERQTWGRHGALEEYKTITEVKQTAESILGEVKVKRKLFYRYTLTWIK